jgi:hypothetical protein
MLEQTHNSEYFESEIQQIKLKMDDYFRDF